MIEPVRDRGTFVALRADGVRVRRGPLSAVHLADESAEVTRLAFAVGRRVGSAVARNRIRRRLRAVFATIDRAQPRRLPTGALLVGVGRGLDARSPAELRADVDELLEALDRRRAESSDG